jgi:hypothetical protein
MLVLLLQKIDLQLELVLLQQVRLRHLRPQEKELRLLVYLLQQLMQLVEQVLVFALVLAHEVG